MSASTFKRFTQSALAQLGDANAAAAKSFAPASVADMAGYAAASVAAEAALATNEKVLSLAVSW